MVCNPPTGFVGSSYSNHEFAYNKLYRFFQDAQAVMTPFEHQQLGNATCLLALNNTPGFPGVNFYKEWLPLLKVMGYDIKPTGEVRVQITVYTADFITPYATCKAYDFDALKPALGKVWIRA